MSHCTATRWSNHGRLWGERRAYSTFSNVGIDIHLCYCDSLSRWIFSLLFLPCLGYPGEGPSLILCSANVSSLHKNFGSIMALGADGPSIDVACLQETRIHPLRTRKYTHDCVAQNWNLDVGYQPSLKKIRTVNHQTIRRQSHGGLAVLTRSSVATVPRVVPAVFPIQEFVQVVDCAVGRFNFVTCNVYLPSGPGSSKKRDVIMSHVFDFLTTVGNLPIVICGDFNSAPLQNPSIARACMTGEWVDVLFESQTAKGCPVGNTFRRVQKKKTISSRIEIFSWPTPKRALALKMLGRSTIQVFLTIHRFVWSSRSLPEKKLLIAFLLCRVGNFLKNHRPSPNGTVERLCVKKSYKNLSRSWRFTRRSWTLSPHGNARVMPPMLFSAQFHHVQFPVTGV